MKFMAAYLCAFGPEHAVRQQPRRAIAEMQFAFGEARRVTEEPGHRVGAPVAILDALAQNHVTAALAVNRARLRKAPQAFGKVLRRCQHAGMQFGVTAW